MQVLRGIEATHTMALNPAFTNVGGKLVTSAAVEGECWLECGDQPEVAVWRYELTTTGWTGRVACTTPGQTAVAVDLVATETPLSEPE